MWVCKLSYGKIISLRNIDKKFYDSIIRAMNMGILLRIRYNRLSDMFRISVHDEGLTLRLIPISGKSCMMAGKFLESKYGLLQLHEILCKRCIKGSDLESLLDVIIPIFDPSFEEHIGRMIIETSNDARRSGASDEYAIRLIERYVEEEAGVN